MTARDALMRAQEALVARSADPLRSTTERTLDTTAVRRLDQLRASLGHVDDIKREVDRLAKHAALDADPDEEPVASLGPIPRRSVR